ncbi:hypothetical protein [Corynebacterium qintianiae]|uniref:hypothetical protein n=1 Tax=Corynebacterium qintianiae TaxID=2709392 RepID=UPI0018C92FDC|nr:hypothetical protein [Corynebacterium qintianiae]
MSEPCGPPHASNVRAIVLIGEATVCSIPGSAIPHASGTAFAYRWATASRVGVGAGVASVVETDHDVAAIALGVNAVVDAGGATPAPRLPGTAQDASIPAAPASGIASPAASMRRRLSEGSPMGA